MHRDDITRLHQADPYFATTLAKGMLLLRAFAPDEGWLGNKALCERTGLSKPTVSRLAKTLVQLGFLRHDQTIGKYSLDVGVLELVAPVLSGLVVRRIARPLMQRLADQVNGAVSLGMARETLMIFIESCIDARAETARPDLGTSRDMATTAMGRAFLASLDDARRLAFYERLRTCGRPDWKTMRNRLEEERERYLTHGFTINRGENRRGLHAAGVAIKVPGHELPMAFNCVVSERRLCAGMLETEIGPQLIELVHAVRAGIGDE